MADYNVTMKNGSTVLIAGVTATPTLVTNDGTATEIKSGTYRDIIAGFGESSLSNATPIPLWGPGWSMKPTWSGSPLALTALTLYSDDRLTGTAPRQIAWDESHWAFVVSTSTFYIPFKEVVAMSNSAPIY